MKWPIRMPSGLVVRQMHDADSNRAQHVRKHLLSHAERWHEITGLSRAAIADARQQIDERGPALALTERLYRCDYAPIAHAAIRATLEGAYERFYIPANDEQVLYILTPQHVVVVCQGTAKTKRWRTAYRLRRQHRPTASLERIHRQHVRSVRRAASYLKARRSEEEPRR